jgi:hypothetical protein
VYINTKNREEYIVYVLCQISRARAEREIDSFAQKISERYGNLIRTQNTLSGALKVYSETYSSLKNNPLHRAVAWFDAQSGRVALYDYCAVQINTLAGSVSFDTVPATALQQGETFSRTIRLASNMFNEIGSASCSIKLTGRNNGLPVALYTLGRNNSFALQIYTSKLESGNYTVQIELLLNEIAPALRQNPRGAFSLEVRPATAVINFEGETLTQGEQRTLTQGLQQALQKYKVPLRMNYEFRITFTSKRETEPISNTALLICEASVAMVFNGNVVLQSDTKRITEMSRDRAVRLVSDFIRDNQNFWINARNYAE